MIKKLNIKQFIVYILITAASLTMIMPLLWMLSASFKPETEVFAFPIQWIPETFLWSNYVHVWTEYPFLNYYINSIKIAVAVTALQVVTCSMAAYSFSRIQYPERDKIFFGYLSTMMIPYQVIMIPQFMIMRNLGLMDTHLALILIGAFAPFGVFLFRQFFITIPMELSEAARIDGCSEFSIYATIILPLAKPAMATLIIFTFIASWNDFLAPLIYINSEEMKTLQLGMRNFQTLYDSNYAQLMAASVCAIVPTIIVFLFTQKYFINGIATSGLKG
ncbi:carbohydrate ABC transporter permease [Vallitalea okinawensis]|uniref:carbohydrate ABC transporter permease n=1 Tax=Vallitalea okinawensis TaxID=2078660 RepID=UPI000CFB83EC|nr:carbohydrate ABC transporter permease [Vallitalea okinawensis]